MLVHQVWQSGGAVVDWSWVRSMWSVWAGSFLSEVHIECLHIMPLRRDGATHIHSRPMGWCTGSSEPLHPWAYKTTLLTNCANDHPKPPRQLCVQYWFTNSSDCCMEIGQCAVSAHDLVELAVWNCTAQKKMATGNRVMEDKGSGWDWWLVWLKLHVTPCYSITV